jgi:hypothetical protein
LQFDFTNTMYHGPKGSDFVISFRRLGCDPYWK